LSTITSEEPDQTDERRDALTLAADNYGPFWKYVSDDRITDADFNGTDLWITDVDGRRTQIVEHGISQDFVRAFSQRVANKVSKPFNKMAPLLEAETSTLRISVLHESAAVSGRSICLRKSLPNVRITAASILETEYMPREILNLLVNCIRSKMNFVIGGEPGAGKTELAKFLTQFIPEDQRVITIEDSPEWHFKEINPGHDCVEMRVTKEFDYSAAIKTCLRQNPKWIALSEARGEEAKWLITSWSTGVNGVTTIHTDDIRKIPGRLIAMMNDRNDAERMISDIYDFVNVGILVRRKAMPDGTSKRYVDQVGFLYRDGDKQGVMQLVRNGQFVSDNLPEDIRFRLERAGASRPFENAILDAQLGNTFNYGAAGVESVPVTAGVAAAVVARSEPAAPAVADVPVIAAPVNPLRRTVPVRPAPSAPSAPPAPRAPSTGARTLPIGRLPLGSSSSPLGAKGRD
jgi:pilus assembly protein CpaF